MPDAEKRLKWLTEIRDPSGRILAISSVVALLFVIVFLHTEVQAFLEKLQWWQQLIVALAAIAIPILAVFELQYAKRANTLRSEANDLRAEENRLQQHIGELTAELVQVTAQLDAERNAHLQQIAKNTQQPITPAARNAAILRNHLGANVSVSEGTNNHWGNTPEIAEVREGDIVTLFTPRSTASAAWCVDVYCGDLEISEIPLGSCPLRLKIIKRHGPDVQLGEITKWEERALPSAGPAFRKGNCVFNAEYTKPGVAERRWIRVYISSDGETCFHWKLPLAKAQPETTLKFPNGFGRWKLTIGQQVLTGPGPGQMVERIRSSFNEICIGQRTVAGLRRGEPRDRRDVFRHSNF